jgi:uncharacterized membrane protein
MPRLSPRRLSERTDLSVPRGSQPMGARYDADAFGRFSEAIARFLGTGRFLVGQTVLVIGWIALNTVGLVNHWDPYPFILLNLAFSTQAAYAAPLILLAQNRQDDRDRANIERDREVAARTQADTEFLARELAAVRLALADVVTTGDLEDSLSRLAKLIADQPLPDRLEPATPPDSELSATISGRAGPGPPVQAGPAGRPGRRDPRSKIRRGRTGRGSSPCSTPRRSRARTSPSRHRSRRPPRARAARSSTRRPGRRGCRST